tara:strand:+ start:145 stop:576 length:432 start_codon:yes stop_codon:yes gene_type:complete
MVYIYKLVDNTNNNIYIGSTKDFIKRISHHKIIKDCSSTIILNNNNYNFIILEECDENIRYEREQYYIDNMDNVINKRDAVHNRKKYYQKNKEKYNELAREYKKNNKEKIKINNKKRLDWKNSWCGDYRYVGNLLRISCDIFS